MKKICLVILFSLVMVFVPLAVYARGPLNDQEVDVISVPSSSGCSYNGFSPNRPSALGLYSDWSSRGMNFSIGNVMGCSGIYLRSWISNTISGDAAYNTNSQLVIEQGDQYKDVYINSSAFSRVGGNVIFSNVAPSRNKGTDRILKVYSGSGRLSMNTRPGFSGIGIKLKARLDVSGWSSSVGDKTDVLYTIVCNNGYNQIIPDDVADRNAAAGRPGYYPFMDQNFVWPGGRTRCDDFGTEIRIKVVPKIIQEIPNFKNDLSPVSKLSIARDGESSYPSSTDSRWVVNIPSVKVGQKVFFKHEANADISGNNKSVITGGWRSYENVTNFDDSTSGDKNIDSRSNISYGNRAVGNILRHGNISNPLNGSSKESPYIVEKSDMGKTICRSISVEISHIESYTHKSVDSVTGNIIEETRFLKPDPVYPKARGIPTVTVKRSSPACFYVPYEDDGDLCVSENGTTECGVDDICSYGCTPPPTVICRNDCGSEIKIPGRLDYIVRFKVDNEDVDTDPSEWVADGRENDICNKYAAKIGISLSGMDCISEKGVYNQDVRDKFRIPDNPSLGVRYCIAGASSPAGLKPDQSREEQRRLVGTKWVYSNPYCLSINKKPDFQVWAGGLYVNGNIRTSRENHSIDGTNYTFGSWAEFDSITSGPVGRFSSGGSNTQYPMTFSNAVSGKEGSFENSKTGYINNTFEALRNSNANPIGNGSSDVQFSKSVPRPFNNQVLVHGKNVYLDQNIEKSLATQQFIILAEGDIFINKDVERLDVILVAKGKIVTCSTGFSDNSDIMKNGQCEAQLQINAPAIARQFKLYRTHGSWGKDKVNHPAEIFNNRLDNYIWDYRRSGGIPVTTYTKELPVRY